MSQALYDRVNILQGFADAKGGSAEFQPASFHFGEIENVVDELKQVPAAGEDIVCVFKLALVELAKGFVHEHF